MDNHKKDEFTHSPESPPIPPRTPKLSPSREEPNGLPKPNHMDRMLEHAQQSPIKWANMEERLQREEQIGIEQQEEQIELKPQGWYSPNSAGELRGLPTSATMDNMIEPPRNSRCEAEEIRNLLQGRDELIRLAQEAKRIVSNTRHRWLAIAQHMHKDPAHRETISEGLNRLEAVRKEIEGCTRRIEARLRLYQTQERQQRLRRRLNRRQQRRQVQQITSYLQQSGFDLGLELSYDEPSQSASHSSSVLEIHPEFKDKIAHLARKLHPLVSYSTGLIHPYFPKSILAFNLLTSEQLDALALHFHQVYPPRRETFRYPLPIKPWLTTNGFVRDLGVDTEVKRRRFGRFIGLRGCESPVKTRRDEGSVIGQVEKDWERRYRNAMAVEERNVTGSYMFMDGLDNV
ncbi:hypothetical protein BDW72DRAFT_60269 [Aspergillus terricola var. indicus]